MPFLLTKIGNSKNIIIYIRIWIFPPKNYLSVSIWSNFHSIISLRALWKRDNTKGIVFKKKKKTRQNSNNFPAKKNSLLYLSTVLVTIITDDKVSHIFIKFWAVRLNTYIVSPLLFFRFGILIFLFLVFSPPIPFSFMFRIPTFWPSVLYGRFWYGPSVFINTPKIREIEICILLLLLLDTVGRNILKSTGQKLVKSNH